MDHVGSGVKKLVGWSCFGVYSGMKKRYFAFLRRLQASGRSNMYGAIPYLMRSFDLTREQAFAIICEWLDLQSSDSQATPPPPIRHVQRTRQVPRKPLKLSKARA
jgi:hypothetical protein